MVKPYKLNWKSDCNHMEADLPCGLRLSVGAHGSFTVLSGCRPIFWGDFERGRFFIDDEAIVLARVIPWLEARLTVAQKEADGLNATLAMMRLDTPPPAR